MKLQHYVPNVVCTNQKKDWKEKKKILLSAKKNTRERYSLPRVFSWHSTKSPPLSSADVRHSVKSDGGGESWRRDYLPSVWHSTKNFLLSVFILRSAFFLELSKSALCRVPEKMHSAKAIALGNAGFSGSEAPPAPTRRDGNSTRGCGYPRILNPMDTSAGLIFHPWVDPHPHPHPYIMGADLRFPPRVDPHPSGKKKPQPNLLR